MHPVLKLALPVALGLAWLPSRAAAASLSDERIEAAVDAALTSSENAAAISGLKPRSDEGILTLGGTVETLYALDQAVRQAGTVPGVVDVVVTATVPRSKFPDSQILGEVQQALQTPSFSFVGFQASVGGGRVVLTGTSGSYAQKLLAEKEISKISGVVEIQNRIAVTSETNVSPEALSRLVLSKLTGGPAPVPGRFQVSVHGSEAILTGRVPLYINRLEASEISLAVPGIRDVDNRLVVDPGLLTPHSDSAQP
jgi:osmotically-inducible protein OsmY